MEEEEEGGARKDTKVSCFDIVSAYKDNHYIDSWYIVYSYVLYLPYIYTTSITARIEDEEAS